METKSEIVLPDTDPESKSGLISPFTRYDTLCCAGGGSKGFILLGAIQACIDNDLLKNINTYIGTSMGAILSYLLAIGYTPVEIVVAVHIHKWFDKLKFMDTVAMINGQGATSFSPINEALERLTLDKIGRFITIGELYSLYGKKLICTTFNMTESKIEYIGPDNHPEIPCLIALRMSSNLPLIFDRFRYMDSYYIDGGIADNFPISKGLELGSSVLGLNLQISPKQLQDDPEKGVIEYIFKLLQIQVDQFCKQKVAGITTQLEKGTVSGKHCEIINLISTDPKNFFSFDLSPKARLELFSSGYTQVKTFLLDSSR
jgi:predicted acylesterase/phospholipase RssA